MNNKFRKSLEFPRTTKSMTGIMLYYFILENSLFIFCRDIYYYGRIVTEKLYSVENDKNIKEYFPLEKVVTSTLEIFQELLALHFKEVYFYNFLFLANFLLFYLIYQLSGVHVWHPEVRVFEVSDKDSSQIVGYFYLVIVNNSKI